MELNEFSQALALEAEAKRLRIKFMRETKKMRWGEIAKELGISRQRLFEIRKGFNEN